MTQKTEKMSRWGIGPVYASLSIAYGALTLFLTWYFYPLFTITSVPEIGLITAGLVFLAAGLAFFLFSVIAVTRAYNADHLVTSGVYRFCRHPLYAAWAVLIVPGIALLAKSWICLTVPLLMCVILRLLVVKEERYLLQIFGDQYREYMRRVPSIIPFGPLFRR